MSKNMNTIDRIIRITIAIFCFIVVSLTFPVFESYIVSSVIVLFGAFNLFAGLFAICVGYKIFGLSTLQKQK